MMRRCFVDRVVVTVVLACVLVVAAYAPAHAATLILDGAAVQGGLVRGLAEPGARAFLNDQELRVSADGRFVFGFGRDDTAPVA